MWLKIILLSTVISVAVAAIRWESFLQNEQKLKSKLLAALTRSNGGRIVGGTEVPIEERPFQVMVYIDGRPLCGGAVINENTILTASHCFGSLKGPKYQVRLGSASYLTGGEIIDVKEIFIHPNYDPYNGYYDAAIVKLIRPVVFSTKIQPIGLSNVDTDPAHGQIATASGWGDLEEEGGIYPENLHKVELPIIDQDLCRIKYTHLGGSQLCAGTSGKDSCQGDSGGPLTYNNFHIGIISSGNGCGQPGWPGIYTRTSAIRDFIEQHS